MREEFDEVEAEFATPRVAEIAAAFDGLEDEDLIEVEDMVVTVTMTGYIKRTPSPCSASRSAAARAVRAWHQGRGRRHRAVRHLDPQSGAVLLQPRPGLPDEGVAPARGRPDRQGPADGQPAAAGGGRDHHHRACRCPQDEAEWGGLHIMFATAKGTVRRNSMDAFTNIPTAGKIAMKFGTSEEGGRKRGGRASIGSSASSC